MPLRAPLCLHIIKSDHPFFPLFYIIKFIQGLEEDRSMLRRKDKMEKKMKKEETLHLMQLREFTINRLFNRICEGHAMFLLQ